MEYLKLYFLFIKKVFNQKFELLALFLGKKIEEVGGPKFWSITLFCEVG